MLGIIKNIIIILGLLALAAIGYYLFVVERDATVANTDFTTVGVSVTSEAFLSRLQDLQNIELSSEIFGDSRFRSLEDFSSIIDRVPFSRDLPFSEVDNINDIVSTDE